jgi:hypothetical protein
MKELFYHLLTHAAHYAALGNGWYAPFVDAEVYEIVNTFISDKGYSPYGRGTDSYGPIIALGEGWAYHIGYYLADKRYTNSCSEQDDQGIAYFNNSPVNNLSSQLNLLENFNPNSASIIKQTCWYPFKMVRCEKASFSISLNSTNQHFYIYQNIESGHLVTDYEQKHAYYFVVK